MEQSKTQSDLTIAGVSANDIKDMASEYLGDFQERFTDFDKRVRSTVNAQPLACVAGAFAIGYVSAKFFRMWRR